MKDEPTPPREVVKPGRVVVYRKRVKTPDVHTAPRITIRMEKNPKGKATLHVVELDEFSRPLRTLAAYKPSEWRKAKVHRPVFKARPEIKEQYRKEQAIAAAMLMNEKFGQGWNPGNVFH